MTTTLKTTNQVAEGKGTLSPQIRQTSQGPIEYADIGSGPVVVAVHGAMGGWDQSELLARCALDDSFRVLAISRPGYLGTPLASGRTPEQQADLIAALLDSLGIEKAALLAISGGGPSAILFALRHSLRCTGLTLIATCSGRNRAPIPVSFHVMTALARIPAVVGFFKRKAFGNLDQSMARSIASKEVRDRLRADPEVMPLYMALMESTFDRMAERITGTKNDIRISCDTDYPLEQIKVPSLAIHGTADRLVPYERHAKEFAARIPDLKLVTVEGGEHVTLFTHRNLVRSEVTGFLKSCYRA